MFNPIYEEMVTNTSDLMVYMVRHVFIEPILHLSFFVAVMLTLFVNWTWIPLSSIDLKSGKILE